MGLDQYSYAKASGGADDGKQEPLVSWRKHHRLHGWMKNLFEEKGLPGINGMDGPNTFNTVELPLTFADVARLESDIIKRRLPKTEGFFFGPDSYDVYEDWHEEDDEMFIQLARQALDDGKTVYYNSWW